LLGPNHMGNKGGKGPKTKPQTKGGGKQDQTWATPQPPPGEASSEKSPPPDPEPEFVRDQYDKGNSHCLLLTSISQTGN